MYKFWTSVSCLLLKVEKGRQYLRAVSPTEKYVVAATIFITRRSEERGWTDGQTYGPFV
jgi:hypothetical protein